MRRYKPISEVEEAIKKANEEFKRWRRQFLKSSRKDKELKKIFRAFGFEFFPLPELSKLLTDSEGEE